MHTVRTWLAKVNMHHLIPTVLGLGSIAIVGIAAILAASRTPPQPSSFEGAQIATSTCPRLVFTTAHPTNVTKIPAQLPCTGVDVSREILLPPGNVTPTVTAAQVISRVKGDAQYPITQAMLVNLTDPATLPPPGPPQPIPGTNQTVQWRPIVDRLTWIVVETFPHPLDVAVGDPRHHVPIYKTRFCVEVDASTGAILGGFFTD